MLGTSRRRRLDELLRGSVINRAIKASPDIDVHVVAFSAADAASDVPPARSSRRSVHHFSRRRRTAAWVVALAGPVLLTAAFVPFRADEGLPGVLPAYMLLVVVAALSGGTAPALAASIVGFAFGNLALTQPYGTLRITELASVVALLSFLAVGALVAVIVGRLGARTAEAERARAQASALAAASASLADDDAVPELLDRLRTVLHLDAVELLDADRTVLASAGQTGTADGLADRERVDLPNEMSIVTSRRVTDNDDRLVLRAFADQLASAVRRRQLADAESRVQALDEIDRFRTALLRSVSHDLRTPLASIKAAASSLQQDDVEWPDDARDEFLSTIVEEGDRLDRIIGNLLDASRLEAGVLAVELGPVRLDDVVQAATRSARHLGSVRVSIDPTTPAVSADRALLERVLDNLVNNAFVHAGDPIEVCARHDGDVVHLLVIDHGVGVPAPARALMFDEFQRLDDHTSGVGLGLAVSRGFVDAMNGSLTALETPGGGLTMQLDLPVHDATPALGATPAEVLP